MRFPIPMLALAAALAFVPGPGRAAEVAGRVFADLDGDGCQAAGEPPLSGVLVSDGERLAETDAEGRFRLPLTADAPVFVIPPAGYLPPLRREGLPDTWRDSPTEDWAVALHPAAFAPPYALRVFGDPQVKNAHDLRSFETAIVEAERRLPRARLGLSLGDIVHGNLALLPAMAAATARMGTPWLTASGNHDRDHGAGSDEASLASFRRVFGPDTFAWEAPGLAVVVLDNVIHQPGSGELAAYVGGLRERQFRFLEAYLPRVPRDALLLLAMHIPLFDTDASPGRDSFRPDDRQRLFRLLEAHPSVLVLSSHTHGQQHRWHGEESGWRGASPLHEYNVGAACGAFWSGVADARGVPDSRMADGTPKGFATLTVQPGGGYALRWHAVDFADDPPFALHAPRVLRRGAWPGFAVYANVWMGDADSRVEYRVAGGEWRPMQRVERPDPALLAINAVDDAAETPRAYDRAPEAAPSPHLWRGALPTDLPTGEHTIEVRVFDRWRGELRQTTRYRLEEALP